MQGLPVDTAFAGKRLQMYERDLAPCLPPGCTVTARVLLLPSSGTHAYLHIDLVKNGRMKVGRRVQGSGFRARA